MTTESRAHRSAVVLVVGPLATTGGVARYTADVLAWKCGCAFQSFNTARPPKKRTSNRTVGYGELLNAGLLRAVQGGAVTLVHLVRFPLELGRRRPALVLVVGVEYWTFWEASVYILVARLLGRRVVFHFLGGLEQYYQRSSRLARWAIRAVFSQATAVAVLSSGAAELVHSWSPCRRPRVVPSAVAIQRFVNIARPRAPAGVVRLGFLGGADPYRKGLADLISAVALVHTQGVGLRLVLAGGLNVSGFAGQWRTAGLDDVVEYVGWVDDVAEFYKSIDALVLPSRNEGLPYAIVEAMAAGLPGIATTVGGIPEVVVDRVTGYLVAPADVVGLAGRISTLVQSADMRNRMGLCGRARATKLYGIDAVRIALHEVLESALTN